METQTKYNARMPTGNVPGAIAPAIQTETLESKILDMGLRLSPLQIDTLVPYREVVLESGMVNDRAYGNYMCEE